MTLSASPRPARIQWPCRVDAETDEELLAIQRIEHDDKSGVVRLIVRLGIETYVRRDRNIHALDRIGLSVESILPYLGDRARASRAGD